MLITVAPSVARRTTQREARLTLMKKNPELAVLRTREQAAEGARQTFDFSKVTGGWTEFRAMIPQTGTFIKGREQHQIPTRLTWDRPPASTTNPHDA